jgi:hypothetical protein
MGQGRRVRPACHSAEHLGCALIFWCPFCAWVVTFKTLFSYFFSMK